MMKSAEERYAARRDESHKNYGVEAYLTGFATSSEVMAEAVRPALVRYRRMLDNEECDCSMDGGVHTCGWEAAEREYAAAMQALAAWGVSDE